MAREIASMRPKNCSLIQEPCRAPQGILHRATDRQVGIERAQVKFFKQYNMDQRDQAALQTRTYAAVVSPDTANPHQPTIRRQGDLDVLCIYVLDVEGQDGEFPG
jgi:hypothetical protein